MPATMILSRDIAWELLCIIAPHTTSTRAGYSSYLVIPGCSAGADPEPMNTDNANSLPTLVDLAKARVPGFRVRGMGRAPE
jgi:hypothetical protein